MRLLPSFQLSHKLRKLLVVGLILSTVLSLVFFLYIFNKSDKYKSLTTPPSQASAAELLGIPNQGFSKFEPPAGYTYFGLGQNFETDAIHVNNVAPGICSVYQATSTKRLPRLLSAYTDIKTGVTPILTKLNTLNSASNGYYIPQISIYAAAGYTSQLLSGQLDASLIQMGKELKQYAKPVLIRPFYEINDTGTHGSIPKDQAISGYKRIVDLVRSGADGNLDNVAWVWSLFPTSSDQNYYQQFYPGNKYVDWVGVSLFRSDTITYASAVSKFATLKGLPVIVSESAPTTMDSQLNPNNITSPAVKSVWFEPYFNYINNPVNNVKAVIYINVNFSTAYAGYDFSVWGDARLQSSSDALQFFSSQVDQSRYQVPVDTLRIGQKPYENKGITGRWEKDGILYVVSGEKLWKLRRSDNTWIYAGLLQNDSMWATVISTPDGLKPWDGEGITAVWYTAFDTFTNGPALRVVSKNRLYRFNYSSNTWDYASYIPVNDSTNQWYDAKVPAVGGTKPWDGVGITAAWTQKDGQLRVVSKDKLWRFDPITGTWNLGTYFKDLPSDNNWQSAPLVDGLKPWEGSGITAAEFVEDGTAMGVLRLSSKDRFWTWNLTTGVWDTSSYGAYGNYRDHPMDSVWRKAPYVSTNSYIPPTSGNGVGCNTAATGALESISPTGVVSGWVQDTDTPGTQPFVHLYLDGPAGAGGTFLQSVRSTTARSDKGVGAYNYTYTVPDEYRTGTRKLYVHAIDTSGQGPNNLLAGSGMTIPARLPAPALNLPVVCSQNGTRATLSWQPVNGATAGYHVRLVQGTTYPGTSWQEWNNQTATSFTFTIEANKPYIGWVHAANVQGVVAGGFGPESQTGVFQCYYTPTPSPTPTPGITITPTKAPTPVITITPIGTTPTPAVTKTPTPTPTPGITITPTKTPTPGITITPTRTPTPVVTITPVGNTPTPGVTVTPTKVPTIVPTVTSTIAVSPKPTTTPSCLAKANGDTNCDGSVDLVDFSNFREEFLAQRKGQLDITKALADFNTDNSVDLLDFSIFREGYRQQRL